MIWVYRKMLLIVCLLLFGLVAPTVIFYAIGFRLGSQAQRPSPVGAVMVESSPRRADVTLNEQLVGRTPRAISGLWPGQVTVAVRREGYIPWEKRVVVEPMLVTELRAVRLWPVAPARQVVSRSVGRYAVSPNRRLLAVQVGPQQVAVYDDEGEIVVPPLATGDLIQDLRFSADGVYVLLITTAGDLLVLEVANPAAGLTPIVAAQGGEWLWDPHIPARLFVRSEAGRLEAINVATGTRTLVAEGARLMTPSNRYLYVVTTTKELKVYGLRGEELRTVAVPSDWEVARLLVTSGDYLALRLADGRLAVRLGQEEWRVVAEGVEEASWSPDGQMLLVQTQPNEVAVVNVDNERLTFMPLYSLHLVSRLSRPITQAQWFAGSQHLLYQVDDQVVITEIDTRDYPVSYTVDSTNRSDAQAVVGEDGEALYYLKTVGGRTNVIMTKLIVEE